jgi:hypothetical protein
MYVVAFDAEIDEAGKTEEKTLFRVFERQPDAEAFFYRMADEPSGSKGNRSIDVLASRLRGHRWN